METRTPPFRFFLPVWLCAFRVALTIGCGWLTLVACADQPLLAQEAIAILDARISGHIHPSICRTSQGDLLVVYQGTNVLMCSRSSDDGQTWTAPEAIATTAQRPQGIRETLRRFEVYPGTANALPDGRVLVTWDFIADAKEDDGYYERVLLYTLSSDGGHSWSDQKIIGPVDGKHLGAIRHNVLAWTDGRWLLPLRSGIPRLFDPATGQLSDFPVASSSDEASASAAFQQMIRTAKGTLLAVGPETLYSADEGRSWTVVHDFPAPYDTEAQNFEGRYLTALRDGRVLVTWGLGHENQGIRYNLSLDDGRTWKADHTRILLPETNVTARYYSARTLQLDDQHIGTVFMNRDGIFFVKVDLARIEP
jgi:hypothetical protein